MWHSYRAWVGAGLFRRSSNSKLTRHSERQTRPAEHSRARKPGIGPANAAIKASVIAFSLLVTPCLKVKAQIIDLGAAQDVAILGSSTVTSTGDTTIIGNLALSPGSAITGFPPGRVQGGTIHINDALASQAHADAFTAYTTLAGEVSPPANNLTGQDLGGKTLTPGVYHFNTSAQLTGILDLNTLGNPDAVFHFQIGSTLTTASNSSVVLLGVAGSDPNIFWQVGSSATIGTGTLFQGNILALTSITFNTGASLTGRALAINGAVTLDANGINGAASLITHGAFWNGGSSNLWSGTNWSPDATGATTGALAPNSDVVFSVTGVLPRNQNTVIDFNAAIASLTINDPAAVTPGNTSTSIQSCRSPPALPGSPAPRLHSLAPVKVTTARS
jgi:type VI secretion system secreted protein VgrG